MKLIAIIFILQGVTLKVSSLEALQEKSEHELRTMLIERNAREEDVRRLVRALHNLKKYTEILLRGDTNNEANDLKLYWDSWDRNRGNISYSPRPPRTREATSSVPSEESLPYNNNIYNNNHVINNVIGKLPGATSLTSINSTPTHHPVGTPPVKGKILGEKSKYPTTPPPHKKHVANQQPLPISSAIMSDPSLTKSRSHESQLGNSENNGLGK